MSVCWFMAGAAVLGGAAWLAQRKTLRSVAEDPDCDVVVVFADDVWEPDFDFADGSAGMRPAPVSDTHLLAVAEVVGVTR